MKRAAIWLLPIIVVLIVVAGYWWRCAYWPEYRLRRSFERFKVETGGNYLSEEATVADEEMTDEGIFVYENGEARRQSAPTPVSEVTNQESYQINRDELIGTNFNSRSIPEFVTCVQVSSSWWWHIIALAVTAISLVISWLLWRRRL